jgi:hypothetical protein
VEARLTTGAEVYPHRTDLAMLPFWKCDACGNHVGCHHKTKDRTRPMGTIPNPELKRARQHIHKLLDSLWGPGRPKRKEVYQTIEETLGYRFHTAELRTIEEARRVYRILLGLAAKAEKPHLWP